MAKTPEFDLRENANFKNYLINGNFDFWQRNTTFTGNASLGYTSDRWRYNGSTTANITVSRQTGGPDSISNYFHRMLVNTADASIAAGDNLLFSQFIEGYNFKELYGKAFTLSFWIRSSTTGILPVTLNNTGSTRSYVTSVTINTANTWEKKIIKVIHNTTGTWDLTSGRGLHLAFTLINGSTYQTASVNQWLAGEFYGPTGATNFLGTNGLTLDFAQIMVGIDNTENFFLHGKNYSHELAACQRYYEKSAAIDSNPNVAVGQVTFFPNVAFATTSAAHPFTYFRVTKRTVPTPYMWDGASNGGVFPASARYTYFQPGGGSTHNTAPGDIFISTNHIGLQVGGIGSHAGVTYGWAADAEL